MRRKVVIQSIKCVLPLYATAGSRHKVLYLLLILTLIRHSHEYSNLLHLYPFGLPPVFLSCG